MTTLDEAARDFIALFERMGIPYAVMGGMAVRIYAMPRPTFDVDFTVVMARDDLPSLYAAAEDLGFTIPAAQAAGWIDSVRGLSVVKFQWFIGQRAIDIDVFLAETHFQQELMRRRQRHAAEGWEGWFVTAEDLILLKLLAGRPKDQLDVADVFFVQGTLDESYLRTWAGRIGIAEALEDALKQHRDQS